MCWTRTHPPASDEYLKYSVNRVCSHLGIFTATCCVDTECNKRRLSMSFWDFLRPPAGTKANATSKPATAAELREALAEAELAAAKAEQDAAVVAQERAELLLEADDKRLDAI